MIISVFWKRKRKSECELYMNRITIRTLCRINIHQYKGKILRFHYVGGLDVVLIWLVYCNKARKYRLWNGLISQKDTLPYNLAWVFIILSSITTVLYLINNSQKSSLISFQSRVKIYIIYFAGLEKMYWFLFLRAYGITTSKTACLSLNYLYDKQLYIHVRQSKYIWWLRTVFDPDVDSYIVYTFGNDWRT